MPERVCKRGHVQAGENVQLDADGKRRCRPCAQLRRRRRYLEKEQRPCPKCGAQMAPDSANCIGCRWTETEVERFERQLVKTETCWVWQGAHDRKGYGRFMRSDGTGERAHRVAYLLFVGPIPAGRELHHTCERRDCVNPAHLEPLTAAEHARHHLEKRYA